MPPTQATIKSEAVILKQECIIGYIIKHYFSKVIEDSQLTDKEGNSRIKIVERVKKG